MKTIASTSDLRRAVAKTIAHSSHQIAHHPLLLRANAQRLTQEQIERWLNCIGREIQWLPTILDNMVGSCSNESLKDFVIKKLNNEYGGGEPNRTRLKLYLDLLDQIGVPHDSFYSYEERVGVQIALRLAYNVSIQEKEAVTLGYLLANEYVAEITQSAIQNALQYRYPTLQHPFFRVTNKAHIETLHAALDALNPSQEKDCAFGICIQWRGISALLDEANSFFDKCNVIPPYDAFHWRINSF
jgi:pyrroloquinoline quinone (PQQ) biosynthesis protein C